MVYFNQIPASVILKFNKFLTEKVLTKNHLFSTDDTDLVIFIMTFEDFDTLTQNSILTLEYIRIWSPSKEKDLSEYLKWSTIYKVFSAIQREQDGDKKVSLFESTMFKKSLFYDSHERLSKLQLTQYLSKRIQDHEGIVKQIVNTTISRLVMTQNRLINIIEHRFGKKGTKIAYTFIIIIVVCSFIYLIPIIKSFSIKKLLSNYITDS